MSSDYYYYDGISLRNGRATNMDSLLLKSRKIQGAELCLAAVCDGVGSLADGAYAASSAVQMLRNWFENLEDTANLGLRLRDYVFSINLAIVTKARSRQIKTACTLSCLLLWSGQYAVVHLGDSRIYTWMGDRLLQLTEDQVRAGRLTAALGHRIDTEVFYTEGLCGAGQSFLICSDGLYKQMDPGILSAAMQKSSRRNLHRTIRNLAEYVIGRGERDNVSVALLINHGKVRDAHNENTASHCD